MDRIRRKQARAHVKFSNLRNGILHEGSDGQAAALLDDTQPQPWRNRPPRQAWPRDPGFVYPPRGATMEDLDELVDERTLLSRILARPSLDEKTMRQGRTTVNQAARRLAEVGFHYYRTLGWGGEGVAALFYVIDAQGRSRKVVAKMALSPSPNFTNEKIMSMQFRGRYHILQRLLAHDLAEGTLEVGAMHQAQIDVQSRLMMFEFAEFGSLSGILKKWCEPVITADDPLGLRADRGRPLPDRVLLRIMHCLATACNDIQRPANVDDWGAPTGADLGPLVHLDFEPSNLLFGGFEAPVQNEHVLMPILKLSDFGLCSPIPNDQSDINETWNMRFWSKPHYFLPEQFSQDWDFVDRHPLENNIDTYGKVAGHYGPNSNVYHLGLTLWTCITGTLPFLPSHANLVVNPLPRFDGAVWFTWGAEILDDSKYGSVDREIRETVVACLAEQPGQRIDSQALLAWCIQKIEDIRHIPGSTDAEFYAWATANMTSPPEPTAETAIPPFDPEDPSDKQFNPFSRQWSL